MKKYYLIILGIISSALFAMGQVGINTIEPTTALDINGDIRIRDIPITTTLTNVLVSDDDGNVYKRTGLTLHSLTSPTKSFVRASGGSKFSLLNLTLLQGWKQIGFDQIEFDENIEYDISSYQYTAKQDGIYDIYAQIKTGSILTVGDIGIGIFKKGVGESNFSLLAEETYLNVTVTSIIAVSPTSRSTKTLVKLKKGDTIVFAAKVPLVEITLLGGSFSFFTIHQVK